MILVTGGTGFVGQEIVRELLARGYKVRVLTRRIPARPPFPGAAAVEYIQGDALRPETLPAALVGVQAVINLIGIIAETPRISFVQAHVETTRNLLAAARAAGVTRWVQMSALGTRPNPRSDYHRTKWVAEELVRASSLDATIFRPSMIYGCDERDRLVNLLKRALSPPLDLIQLDTFPVLDGGRARVQPVCVREVARCFVAALARAGSVGQTYDLVGPEPLSWREVIFTVARALGHRPLYEEYPILIVLRGLLWLAIAALLVMLVLSFWFAGPVVGVIAALGWLLLVVLAWRWRRLIVFNIPSGPLWLASSTADELAPSFLRFGGQFRMLEEDNIGDPAPAVAMFGYVPETFETGVRRLVAPYA